MTRPPTPHWNQTFFVASCYAAVLFFAFLLRAWGLSRESLWFDEWAVFQHVGIDSFTDFVTKARLNDPPAGPLYLVWMFGMGKIFGASVMAFRICSLLLGLITLGVTMLMARDLAGNRLALLAGVFLAIEPTSIYYSQEIRAYMPVMLMGCLSNWAFYRWNSGKGRGWLYLNLIANFTLPLWHWFGALLVVTQALCFPLFSIKLKRIILWAAAHIPAVGCTLGWILTVDHARLNLYADYMQTPHLEEIALVLLGGLRFQFFTPILVIFLLLLFTKRKELREQYYKTAVFLAVWAFLPTLLLLLISSCYRPCFLERYIAFRIPGLVVLLCLPLALGAESFRPKSSLALIMAVFVPLAYITAIELIYATPRRFNNEAVADRIRQDYKNTPKKTIVYCGRINKPVLEWMLRPQVAEGVIEICPINDLNEKSVQNICRKVAGGTVVYIYAYMYPAQKNNVPAVNFFLLSLMGLKELDSEYIHAVFLTNQLDKAGVRTAVEEIPIPGPQMLYEFSLAASAPTRK